jgi:hypothetical protein
MRSSIYVTFAVRDQMAATVIFRCKGRFETGLPGKAAKSRIIKKLLPVGEELCLLNLSAYAACLPNAD